MGDLIGKGRFPKIPESRKNNITLELDEMIDSGKAGSNVEIFQEIEVIEDENKEIDDLQDLIVEVIDNIIELGIEEFRNNNGKDNYLNLHGDTIDIWNEMFFKACGIEDGLRYMEEEDEFPFVLDNSYILQAISDILNPYQKTVFKELKQKYKYKKQ